MEDIMAIVKQETWLNSRWLSLTMMEEEKHRVPSLKEKAKFRANETYVK